MNVEFCGMLKGLLSIYEEKLLMGVECGVSKYPGTGQRAGEAGPAHTDDMFTIIFV